MFYGNIIPPVFTEQDRQEAIARALSIDDATILIQAGVPGRILKLGDEEISTVLRLVDDLSLDWSQIKEGYRFSLVLDEEQKVMLTCLAGEKKYALVSLTPKIYVDPLSFVPFVVV